MVRGLLRSPLHRIVDDELLLLHVRGRRSGRRYDIPVSYVDLGDAWVVLTQHGWRANLRGGAVVDVTHHGRRQARRAVLEEEPAAVAGVMSQIIEKVGPRAARRRIGLVIEDGHTPTTAQLTAAVREFGLGVVRLTPVI
jgi:hypothetical protein